MWPLWGTLLFALLVPCTVAGVFPYFLITAGAQAFRFQNPALYAAGVPVFAAGVAIYAWCAYDFAFAGRGTPSPTHPPRELVVRGLYRYSRNPMYVGVTSILAGEALLSGAGNQFIYLIIVALGFHLRVVLGEEKSLREKFGSSYEAYCARVPRWFGTTRSKT